MEWLELTIYTTKSGIEPVCGRLYQIGINGVSIEDEEEFKEFLEENRQSWDYVDDDLMQKMHKETTVKFYVSNTPEGMETLSMARQTIAELKEYDNENIFGRLEISSANLKEEDWANNWKQYFHTLQIGDNIIIKPEWEEYENKDNKTVFSINPGMSFGTGTHHTTKMCIEALEHTVKKDDEVLDLGTGSGILSLISLLLGAKSAKGIDIDPVSVNIARQNADLNGIGDEFSVMHGNVVTDEKLQNELLCQKFDLVLANIVADVIIAIAPFAYKAVKDNGIFITSGIIEDRIDEVISKLQEVGFEIAEEKRSADWACFVCKKGVKNA